MASPHSGTRPRCWSAQPTPASHHTRLKKPSPAPCTVRLYHRHSALVSLPNRPVTRRPRRPRQSKGSFVPRVAQEHNCGLPCSPFWRAGPVSLPRPLAASYERHEGLAELLRTAFRWPPAPVAQLAVACRWPPAPVARLASPPPSVCVQLPLPPPLPPALVQLPSHVACVQSPPHAADQGHPGQGTVSGCSTCRLCPRCAGDHSVCPCRAIHVCRCAPGVSCYDTGLPMFDRTTSTAGPLVFSRETEASQCAWLSSVLAPTPEPSCTNSSMQPWTLRPVPALPRWAATSACY